MKEPMVKLFDVVAMRVVPSASETMIELAAKEVALVPPDDTGRVPVREVRDKHVVPIA